MHVNWTIYRAISVNTNYEVSIHGHVRNRKTKRILKPYNICGYNKVMDTYSHVLPQLQDDAMLRIAEYVSSE